MAQVYGFGKTYFIDKFYNNRTEQYLPVKINPVNYSVSSNQDVFEFIKYDIANQLPCNKNLVAEDYDFGESLLKQSFFINNYKDI